jgi:hypothetical protein
LNAGSLTLTKPLNRNCLERQIVGYPKAKQLNHLLNKKSKKTNGKIFILNGIYFTFVSNPRSMRNTITQKFILFCFVIFPFAGNFIAQLNWTEIEIPMSDDSTL